MRLRTSKTSERIEREKEIGVSLLCPGRKSSSDFQACSEAVMEGKKGYACEEHGNRLVGNLYKLFSGTWWLLIQPIR